MPITLDRTRAPLNFLRFEGTNGDADFRRCFDECDEMLAANQRYGIVIDGTNSDGFTATQRSANANWFATRAPQLRRLCVGAAFSIRSPLVRGTLTAIMWLAPIPMPHTILPTASEAEAWVKKRLVDARLL